MKATVAIILMTVSLVGCGSGYSVNSSGSTSTFPDIPGAGGSLKDMQAGSANAIGTMSVAPIALQGGWSSGCMDGSGTSYSVSLVVSGTDAWIVNPQYDSTGCAAGSLNRTVYQHYTYNSEGTATDALTDGNHGLTTLLYTTLNAVQIVPHAAQAVTDLNSVNAHTNCNTGTTWTTDVGQSVMGCRVDDVQYAAAVDQTTIFKITGNTMKLSSTSATALPTAGQFGYFTK